MAGKKFRYALDPLRLKSEWDVEAARRALTQVGEQVKAQQSELDALTADYHEARQGLQQTVHEIAPLMLQMRTVQQAYLQQAAHRVQCAHRRLDELSQAQQRTLEQAVQLHKYHDNLERDRSLRRDEHRRSLDASLARDAEELWLSRRHRVEPRHET